MYQDKPAWCDRACAAPTCTFNTKRELLLSPSQVYYDYGCDQADHQGCYQRRSYHQLSLNLSPLCAVQPGMISCWSLLLQPARRWGYWTQVMFKPTCRRWYWLTMQTSMTSAWDQWRIQTQMSLALWWFWFNHQIRWVVAQQKALYTVYCQYVLNWMILHRSISDNRKFSPLTKALFFKDTRLETWCMLAASVHNSPIACLHYWIANYGWCTTAYHFLAPEYHAIHISHSISVIHTLKYHALHMTSWASKMVPHSFALLQGGSMICHFTALQAVTFKGHLPFQYAAGVSCTFRTLFDDFLEILTDCSVVSRQQWSTSFLLFPDSNDRHPFWRACRKLQISSMWWTPTSLYDILLRWASIAVSNLLDMSSSPLASWPLNQVCVAWLWYQPPCSLAANQKRPGRPSRTSNWLIYCISHHQTCQRSLMLCNSNELVEDGWLLLHVLS